MKELFRLVWEMVHKHIAVCYVYDVDFQMRIYKLVFLFQLQLHTSSVGNNLAIVNVMLSWCTPTVIQD